jgi:hypothetical protein
MKPLGESEEEEPDDAEDIEISDAYDDMLGSEEEVLIVNDGDDLLEKDSSLAHPPKIDEISGLPPRLNVAESLQCRNTTLLVLLRWYHNSVDTAAERLGTCPSACFLHFLIIFNRRRRIRTLYFSIASNQCRLY